MAGNNKRGAKISCSAFRELRWGGEAEARPLKSQETPRPEMIPCNNVTSCAANVTLVGWLAGGCAIPSGLGFIQSILHNCPPTACSVPKYPSQPPRMPSQFSSSFIANKETNYGFCSSAPRQVEGLQVSVGRSVGWCGIRCASVDATPMFVQGIKIICWQFSNLEFYGRKSNNNDQGRARGNVMGRLQCCFC